MAMEDFQSLYEKLNPAQKEAVDTIEGPVMVVAGPGTGKTQILTLRIANILIKTDTAPDSILALTFTRSGVQSMRKRLVEIMGAPGFRVNVFTFHGFCNEVIRSYPEEFPRIIGSSQATRADQIALMEKVITETDLEYLKPYGDNFYYLHPTLSEIERLKRENVSPEKCSELVEKQWQAFQEIPDLYHEKGAYKGKMKGPYKDKEKKILRNREFCKLYSLYEEELFKAKLYDFGDMIMEVVRRLEDNEDLRLRLQEEYQYILADEHQDANNAQNRLLELLSSFHNNPNLFIVGDEKQAIFQFQGASLDNFAYFRRLYPGAKLISLTENYRSTQSILDSAHSLISKSKILPSELIVSLRAQESSGKTNISLLPFTNSEYESLFLVDEVRRLSAQGVNYEDIAIIYRDNKDANQIVPYLEKADIPYVIESEENILLDRDINKLVLILRSVSEVGNDELFLEMLYLDIFDFDLVDVYKITSLARGNKISVMEVLKSEEKLSELELSNSEAFHNFYEKYARWVKLARNKNLAEVFDIILNDSGYLPYLLALPGATEKIEKLRALFDEIKTLSENHRHYSLRNFINYLDLLELHGTSITKKTLSAAKGVRLMTAHKSKGLEFDYVYIIQSYDGKWGNKRGSQKFDLPVRDLEIVEDSDDDDERRLFYVALTRAKKEVKISYPTEGEEGKILLPTRFIEEIDPELVATVPTADYEAKFKERREEVFKLNNYLGPEVKNREFLNELFYQKGLSVTDLNNYLTCPWTYFFNNLLMIPRAKTKQNMYGSAVHEALCHFFNKLKDEGEASKELLIALFEEALRKQPLSLSAYEEALEKGKNSLSGYYDKYYQEWIRTTLNELKVGRVQFEGRVHLTGNIDKIEFLDDAGHVNVVDYKTGSPKSRNEVEGKTKTSKGNYKRQLLFYKLLLDRYQNGKYKMVSGEIDFVEPDKTSGKYRKEKFEIENEELKELEETIKRVSEEILNLSFWDTRCGEKGCGSCHLRDMLHPS